MAETIVTGLSVPWGIAFLKDGRAIVGQRDRGTISVIDPKAAEGKRVQELGTVPGVFAETGASRGLLGLALDPEDESQLYAFYTMSTEQRIARIGLKAGKLGDIDRDFVPAMGFYCSAGARFITGQTISIDGGKLMAR